MSHSFKDIIGKSAWNLKANLRILTFYTTKNIDITKNIIIAGSPRSGTTWLAEILQEEKGAFMMFEPLSLKSKKIQQLGFDWRQHIPENTQWQEAEELFRKLYNGKYITPWMLSHSPKRKLLTSEFLIFKFVRANLLLPWLIQVIQPKRKPIFIIRNPVSVVKSQMENNWDIKAIGYGSSNSEYSKIYYQQFAEILRNARTATEILTARWCLDNYYLINHPQNNKKWITVYYDKLISDPENELRIVYDRLSIPFNTSVINRIPKKSKSSYIKSLHKDYEFNIQECLNMVEKFKLSNYINESIL